MTEYSIDVNSVKLPNTTTNPYDNITFDWTQPQYTPTYSYFSTVDWGTAHYFYQLICPRCKETNWGEVNVVVTCSGKTGRKACGARLKAVKDVVDFEVPVK